MSRAYNFSAGPAALPEPVLRQVRDELLEWRDERASVMEVSHRGKAFIECAAEAERDLRELMAIPADYHVLFLQGGATTLSALLALNLARADQTADIVLTGHWGEKALENMKPSLQVNVAATAKAGGYTGLPAREGWRLTPGAAFLHYTPNETIHGVEFHDIPDAVDAPLVADVSSNFLSAPVDVSRFGVLYGGAQKNLGPSGLSIAIVRKDLLGKHGRALPPIFELENQAKNDSMFNTPPTFAWYVLGLVLKWVRAEGGAAAMGERNRRKAANLYAAIDGSGGFYRNPVEPAARSWMNVPFFLPDEAREKAFLKEADAAGLLGLKGHRAVGGIRASIYNAMPEAGVQALVDFMADFARRNG
ncbi:MULTISPECIES: 3-phosphoserine/phosphohydroxythreonine transaminase [unclassified Arenimonas]|uniref:3-phosphoserine/phosphohydroxythreonine transaminase n=1 Tax=unclassified Arenimonas TaxID=2641713 RepID=UPI00086A8368|nr:MULTISPECIES: 3-phosphoserine/phosphohydroxythreonine transaminase [unclassified Arenimonas]ODS62285.1 MAG: phosphoserine transaminase [Arenimonas sp. SCN 70-307]